MSAPERLRCDVLVVGAGAAGLRAAAEAALHGARTLVVCKSLLGKAQSVMAEGGIAAAMNDGDPAALQAHADDTSSSGCFIGDPRMAQLLAKETPPRVRELEAWGALFDRDARGDIALHPASGHAQPRLVKAGTRTGMETMRALQQRNAALGVQVIMECAITRVLTHDGRVCGALGFRRQSGAPLLIECASMVLATGGGARAWKIHGCAAEHTADGIGLALDAGAELVDMEFMQFHPTGLAWPPGARGSLVGESLRHAGATLANSSGHRFIEGRDLAPGHAVGRAIQAEVAAGRGGPHGGVYLELPARPARAGDASLDEWKRHFARIGAAGVVQSAEPGRIEVAPTCFYTLGGVRVDAETGASSVAGLFAAGETAGGLHGADRLIGNSLAEALVFGARAGRHAALRAFATADRPRIDEAQAARHGKDLCAPLERRRGESPYRLLYELQDCMQDNLGLTRTARGLALAQDKLDQLRHRLCRVAAPGSAAFNGGWQLALELAPLLAFAQAVTHAASLRTESRGSHGRQDFPAPDEKLDRANLVLWRATDRTLAAVLVHRDRALPTPSAPLRQPQGMPG